MASPSVDDTDAEPTPFKTRHRSMKIIQLWFSLALVSPLLAGCGAMAQLAYDSAAEYERQQCERFTSMGDRQACLQRVNIAQKQADAQRNKRD